MIAFKNLPDGDKPRERLIKVGETNLTNEELIEIVLKTGTRTCSIKELSCLVLEKVNNITDLKKISLTELTNIKGIGLVKAIELKAAIELGRRVYENVAIDDVIECTTPMNIINYFNYLFKEKKQEEFYVLYLDNKKKYLSHKLLFIGSVNYSIVHPRDIFREAYLISASYLICIHNHPSGDASPSKEDITITEKLKEISYIHSIPLIDHIIIGNNCYYSFYEDKNL
jgi:DNA repair protein RadC